MRVVCIIQARMGSERLPGKVLMDIVGKPMLDHILVRLSHSQRITEVVVATSSNPEDDLIARFCQERNTSVFRGSELDVLARYYDAACQYQADIVVRVTADCPLVDYEGIDELIGEIEQRNVDYLSFNSKPLPRGLTGEVFTFAALKLAHETAHQPYEREHVTIHMYEHPEKFRLASVEAPAWMHRPNYRLTVDTPADIQLIRSIYEILLSQREIIDLQKVIELMDHSPELQTINGHIQQKDPKK
ncbi:3-deoxy-manno-octulosonate cytidylyltransferase [Desulfosporosinus acididurans]|uniref:3-deoxy-manno-octulosonate cytidylyltransferase n=1 Tax=Desulfosporosinus acididurans TaxID=476652 RepID=A0A0J1FQT8_9FIRM|nr:glycosyltransferase family protein [Desulfosporosinus acididurans]KLU65869.1 3-deoxy-manno-octulosonate cytidylyltransferase [Desulfosporosinus acididurans]